MLAHNFIFGLNLKSHGRLMSKRQWTILSAQYDFVSYLLFDFSKMVLKKRSSLSRVLNERNHQQDLVSWDGFETLLS